MVTDYATMIKNIKEEIPDAKDAKLLSSYLHKWMHYPAAYVTARGHIVYGEIVAIDGAGVWLTTSDGIRPVDSTIDEDATKRLFVQVDGVSAPDVEKTAEALSNKIVDKRLAKSLADI